MEEISYSDSSREQFETAIGMTIEEASELYDCYIFLKGCNYYDYPEIKETGKKFVDCYCNCIQGYGFHSQVETPIDKYKVEHMFPEGQVGVYDINHTADYNSKAEWHDQHGKLIARLDTRGNIQMIEFYFVERNGSGRQEVLPFLTFHEILKQAWGDIEGRQVKELVRDCLTKLNPKKIVQLVTGFDKDAYIKEAEKRIEEMTDTVIKTSTSETKILSLQLDKERKHRNFLVNQASSSAFAHGVGFVNDNMGWEFKDNRLYYKKPIYVKRCNYFSKTWEISQTDKETYFIKNLSILIEPYPKQAYCSYANHPNVATHNAVCIGDLQNATLMQVLADLPTVLETAGLVAPWRHDSMRELLSHAVSEKDGEFTPDVEDNVIWKLNPDVSMPDARRRLRVVDFYAMYNDDRVEGFEDDAPLNNVGNGRFADDDDVEEDDIEMSDALVEAPRIRPLRRRHGMRVNVTE